MQITRSNQKIEISQRLLADFAQSARVSLQMASAMQHTTLRSG